MSTKQFYYICLIGITFLAGCFLLLLKTKMNKSQESKGIVFIALGMFSWTAIVFYKLFDPPVPSLLLSDIDRVFSVFTNIFFVVALPFFSNVFIKFREYFSFFRNTEQWVNRIFIFFAFLTVLFAVIDRNVESEYGKNVIVTIDSFFSFLSIGLISYAMYKSITKTWNDLLSKIFIGFSLFLFPSSQILLPLTAIFPDQLGSIYFPVLILLLIGIIFFNFTAIAYYSMPVLGMDDEVQNSTSEIKNNNLQIELLKMGFDDLKRLYFIELEFVENNIKRKERIESRKMLLPFSNWVLFSLAKKVNVKLLNQDISLTKYRMVEYWNKKSDIKLSQEVLFLNDRGLFEFSFDANSIEISNLAHLETKLIITETVQKNIENFTSLFPGADVKKLKAKDLFNLINQEK